MRRIDDPAAQVPLRTAMSGRLIVRDSCGASAAARVSGRTVRGRLSHTGGVTPARWGR